jgi:hypothetical protein
MRAKPLFALCLGFGLLTAAATVMATTIDAQIGLADTSH